MRISRSTTSAKNRGRKAWKLLPLTRAIIVLSAVGVATTLATFAALQSSGNALTGNTIQTATATLKISKDGTNWSDTSLPGYTIDGIVPGGSFQEGGVVYLKNVGTAPVALQLTVPTPPTVTGVVELSKVLVGLKVVGMSTVQTFPLSDLLAGNVAITGTPLAVNGVISYHVQASMTADAVNGSSATISGLDLSFSGVPQP